MVFTIISLLPFSFILGYFALRWDAHKKMMIAHKEEIAIIQKLFYKMMDYKYSRVPLVAETQKEQAYLNKLKVYYKNTTRKVELVPRHLHDDNPSYEYRVNGYVKKYCDDSREEIEMGKREYSRQFQRLRDFELLDYFSNPYALASKAFIYSQIQFLLDNPEATHGNYKQHQSDSSEIVW